MPGAPAVSRRAKRRLPGVIQSEAWDLPTGVIQSEAWDLPTGVIQSEAWDLLFDEINELRTADSSSLGVTHYQ